MDLVHATDMEKDVMGRCTHPLVVIPGLKVDRLLIELNVFSVAVVRSNRNAFD